LPVTVLADYNFSCNDPAFLQKNFHPVIFDRLPWQLLTAKSGFTKPLSDDIKRGRGEGASFLRISNHRNEAVASRWVFVWATHLQWCVQLKACQHQCLFVYLPAPELICLLACHRMPEQVVHLVCCQFCSLPAAVVRALLGCCCCMLRAGCCRGTASSSATR